jgi:hypothetical protein
VELENSLKEHDLKKFPIQFFSFMAFLFAVVFDTGIGETERCHNSLVNERIISLSPNLTEIFCFGLGTSCRSFERQRLARRGEGKTEDGDILAAEHRGNHCRKA